MIYRNRLVLLGGLLLLVASGRVQAQSDLIETLRTANPESLNQRKRDELLQQLEWRMKVREEQMERIMIVRHHWQAEYDELEDSWREASDRLAEAKVDMADGDMLAVELREVQARLAALDVESKSLGEKLSVAKSVLDANLRSKRLDLQRAAAQLELAQNELALLQKLDKAKGVSAIEVQKAEFAAKLAAMEVEKSKVETEVLEAEGISDSKLRLVETEHQRDQLERRRTELQKQLETVRGTIREFDPKTVEFQKEMLLKMIERSRLMEADLLLENAELEALHNLWQMANTGLKGAEEESATGAR